MNFFRALSVIFVPLFGLGVWIRNRFYDWGLFKSQQIGVPVISVGNISTGGTGKTPFSIWLIEQLLAEGKRPAYLSRGYGRSTSGFLKVEVGMGSNEVGDEARMVAGRYPDVVVAVCEDRVSGAKKLVAEYHADVIVLDDAFQHRRIKRDLDIVLIDGGKPPHRDTLLPAGNLRELRGALQRADVVLFTKTPDQNSAENLAKRYSKYRPGFLSFRGEQLIAASQPDSAIALPIEQKRSAFAFSGIARPGQFQATLEASGLEVKGQLNFPDHHAFKPADLAKINDKFASLLTPKNDSGREAILVTTEKDYWRLRDNIKEIDHPVYFIRLETNWDKGEGDFLNTLKKTINE